MIKREFNADFINYVANDPSVKGGAKVNGVADLSSAVSDLRNVLITFEHGGFLLINKSSAVYEVHTMALKQGRGPMLREAIKEMLDYLFMQTDCERLVTVAYKDNPSAMRLSDEFMELRGETGSYCYYDLAYHDWVMTSQACRERGHLFHESVETNHEEDSTHDFHVGGALRMVEYGNVSKAKKLYNEWAVMSGYAPCQILNVSPLILGVGDMRLVIHNHTIEVI